MKRRIGLSCSAPDVMKLFFEKDQSRLVEISFQRPRRPGMSGKENNRLPSGPVDYYVCELCKGNINTFFFKDHLKGEHPEVAGER
jgi:hypothetical protein